MADNESTSVTKDLGIVSAYGYAKAAGYTGTEEEFEQIFLEFTENAPGLLDRLDDAVDAAEDAESTAVSAKNTAVDAKDAAVAAAATFTTDTTLSVSGKAADAKVTGDEVSALKTSIDDIYIKTSVVPTWYQGYIKSSNGAVGADSNYCYSNFVEANGEKYIITGASGYNVKVLLYNTATVGGYDGELIPLTNSTTVTIKPTKGTYFRIQYGKGTSATTPQSITDEVFNLAYISATDDTLSKEGKAADAKTVGDRIVPLENRSGVKDATFSSGGYITTPAVGHNASLTPMSNSSYCYVAIQCSKGQPFVVTGTTDGNSGRAVFMFTDQSNLKCLVKYTASETLTNYQVYAPDDGYLIVNSFISSSHNVYSGYTTSLIKGITDNANNIDDIIKSPLTTLTPNFLGALAYRTLGSLSKGYIVMMTDDGKNGLATDTIPLAIEKEVPFTFALWSTSDVFSSETYTATVLDAVENHGCSIAQHGGSRWDDKSERWLNEFFDSEATFWQTLGVEVKGAVIPGHWTNELIKAVCGGRFGVVRSGGAGTDYDTQQAAGTVTNYYDYYTSGARSNVFCLSSYNNAVDAAINNSNAYNKAAIDYAYANNKILICYFHENQMDSTRWDAVADMIDYAKTKGLTFTTLGEIPYLL